MNDLDPEARTRWMIAAEQVLQREIEADELDRKAHRIMAEFGMQDDRNASGESKKETL